jgi:hypothetical protein
MRALFQLNIILQVVWMIAIVAGIFQPFLWLYIAILMGSTHLLFSFMILIWDGLKSKLIHHFYLSVIYIALWFLVGYNVIQLDFIDAFTNTNLNLFIIVAPAVALAIHYWHVSFTHLNPFKRLEHNVFDL